jgi:putative inorganic carbon (hco3(-)) transporter
MRAMILIAIFGIMFVTTLRAPYIGVLGWTWITLMSPHQYLWGAGGNLPVNLLQVVLTMIAWGCSRDPKRIPFSVLTLLLLMFIFWMTLTTVTALEPNMSWDRWNRFIKVMSLGPVIAGLMNNRVRVHGTIWVVAISLGYFGVRGGLYTLASGGGGHVVGEAGFGDNNALALAMCMSLPLMNYLRLHSDQARIRLGLVGAMGLTALAILGTYSRGGLIGLLSTGLYLWWRSRQKIIIGIVLVLVVSAGAAMMPQSWIDRMNTVKSANEDNSFMERVAAWHVAMAIAKERPFVGGGFGASEVGRVFMKYADPSLPLLPGGLAYHSIYFQVLGDHGVVGFLIYYSMIAAAWWQCSQIRNNGKRYPELGWAVDLAGMIQVSLFAFLVSGAALAMAYFDLIYVLMGVLISMQMQVRKIAGHRADSWKLGATAIGAGRMTKVADPLAKSLF